MENSTTVTEVLKAKLSQSLGPFQTPKLSCVEFNKPVLSFDCTWDLKPLVWTHFAHRLFLMIIHIFYWCLRPKIKFSNDKNSALVHVIVELDVIANLIKYSWNANLAWSGTKNLLICIRFDVWLWFNLINKLPYYHIISYHIICTCICQIIYSVWCCKMHYYINKYFSILFCFCMASYFSKLSLD